MIFTLNFVQIGQVFQKVTNDLLSLLSFCREKYNYNAWCWTKSKRYTKSSDNLITSYRPWIQQLFIYSKSQNVQIVLFHLRGGIGSIKKDDDIW